MHVIAQEDKSTLEIKIVVETFLKDFNNRDIDFAMQHASVNYSNIIDNNTVIDYAQFKSELVNRINIFFKNRIDYFLVG